MDEVQDMDEVKPVIKPVIVKTIILKKVECFTRENLPLHSKCPYDKKKIDVTCALCIRKTEKVIRQESSIIGDG